MFALQEIRGDEPPGKRAKRGDSQSRAQNPNLSRALEHIMQVAAEAQDAQSSSPMLRQARVGRGRLSGINICMKAVRDEEVSHVLRHVLKEIKVRRLYDANENKTQSRDYEKTQRDRQMKLGKFLRC